ncbi:unnamed protein product [Prunus brigantina]
MESKEYSEALSILSGLITEVRRLVDKLLLVDIDLMRSTVRVSHRLPLVFFVVSELKHRLPLAFIARKRKQKPWFRKIKSAIKHSQRKKERFWIVI